MRDIPVTSIFAAFGVLIAQVGLAQPLLRKYAAEVGVPGIAPHDLLIHLREAVPRDPSNRLLTVTTRMIRPFEALTHFGDPLLVLLVGLWYNSAILGSGSVVARGIYE